MPPKAKIPGTQREFVEIPPSRREFETWLKLNPAKADDDFIDYVREAFLEKWTRDIVELKRQHELADRPRCRCACKRPLPPGHSKWFSDACAKRAARRRDIGLPEDWQLRKQGQPLRSTPPG